MRSNCSKRHADHSISHADAGQHQLLMRKVWSAVFVALLVLCGCSGFTTDGDVANVTVDEQETLQQQFAAARTYRTGTYEISESVDGSRTGSITISFNQEDGSVQLESYGYSFGKDTLYLTSTQTDAAESATVLTFVGGTAGKLQGIWRLVSSDNATYYWKFENNTIEIRVADTNSAAASEEVVSELEGEFYAAHDFLKRSMKRLGKSADGNSEVYVFGTWVSEKCGGQGMEECGRCEKGEDGYKWYGYGNVDPFFYWDTITIAFRGDTLLYQKNNEEKTTLWLTGGTSKNLKGIWKQGGLISGGIATVKSYNGLVYMKFDDDDATIAYGMNPDYDYMETELIYEVKNHLVDGSYSMDFDDAFDDSEIELEDGITLLSHSNTSDVVSINGKTYEITLNYAYWLWQDVSVTVKSSDMTCSGRYVQFEQTTQEMCSAENEEYLETFGEDGPFYIIDEQASFEQCLDQMRAAQ